MTMAKSWRQKDREAGHIASSQEAGSFLCSSLFTVGLWLLGRQCTHTQGPSFLKQPSLGTPCGSPRGVSPRLWSIRMSSLLTITTSAASQNTNQLSTILLILS